MLLFLSLCVYYCFYSKSSWLEAQTPLFADWLVQKHLSTLVNMPESVRENSLPYNLKCAEITLFVNLCDVGGKNKAQHLEATFGLSGESAV